MPYIGNTPALDYISYAVQNFTVTAGTTVYTLDYSVSNENDIRLVINNVIQRPGVSYAYSATGTTLTLTSATLATDTMYAVFIGRAVQTVTPPAGSVTTTMLASGFTLPVANGGTNLSSGFFNGITMVDRWRLTTDFTNTAQPIASNLERADETDAGFIGTGMTQSSGIFTFPSTGIYLIQAQFAFQLNGDVRDIAHAISRTTNNSTYAIVSSNDIFIRQTSSLTTWNGNFISYTFDVTNVSTHKVRFDVEVTANTATTTRGTTTSDLTAFTFIRLGDT